MIKKAFVMQITSGAHQEYQRRHEDIWPELAQTLKAHGAHHYSIFLDKKKNLLFGYVEIESETRWDDIANTDVCKKWWKYMSDIMPSNPDNSPISNELTPVFYLD
ncbi:MULTISPECIES: L-rhamnose mutarotase [Providencia]|uniref:L-rhamnose mutarotase n=1 Tax=Providencia TaxID=586 RepID=UPI000838A296|nr:MULTISPECIES: L-rhamnose mutarotase [Providencia]MBP6120823.1 L-rhamnose mutarotase [Providencia sp.]NIH23282.1 L-rhamnose mutarotase [Providencia heimbachae]